MSSLLLVLEDESLEFKLLATNNWFSLSGGDFSIGDWFDNESDGLYFSLYMGVHNGVWFEVLL